MTSTLSTHALAALVLTGLAFLAFATEILPVATIGLLILVLLVTGFTAFPYETVSGPLAPSQLFLAFGHEALIAICALMILGRGLTVTGALEPAARMLARSWKAHPRASLLWVLLACAVASGVVNDTPIVVLMIPVLVSVATRTGGETSSLLLPMNYAVLMGGMGTTIGTSTNLLVVAIASDLGVRRFGMFDYTHVTALAAIPGILYLWVVVPRLLPHRGTGLPAADTQVFDAWLYVQEHSAIAGTTLREAIEKTGRQMRVLEIKRGDELRLARLATAMIRAGDRLLVRDTAKNLKEFEQVLGASLHNLDDDDAGGAEMPKSDENASQQLASIMVTEDSPLLGTTVRAYRFADRFGLIVLGLRRAAGSVVRGDTEIDNAVLARGDLLLVQGMGSALAKLKEHGAFLVLDGTMDLPRTRKAPAALAILACVVVLAATGVLPIAVSALAGVAAMLVARCIDWKDIGSSLSSKVVLIVASSLALASVLSQTGATDFLARQFVMLVAGLSPAAVLGSLMLLMALVTNFVSNSAAAAIGTPVAIGIASTIGVNPEPFVLAVLFGANLCYATPMGYQTNLLVMSAAGYQFADFLRAGIPLTLLMASVFTLLLPRFFPWG